MKTLLSLAVSAALLGIIYWMIDFPQLIDAFRLSDVWLLALGIAFVVPTTLLTAWRLTRLLPVEAGLSLARSTRIILAGSVLNIILPSKMGDVAKFAFLRQRGVISGATALSTVVFEKAVDLVALLVWCALGLAVFSGEAWFFRTMLAVVGAGALAGGAMLVSRNLSAWFFKIAIRLAPARLADKVAALRDAWFAMHAHFWRNRRFGAWMLAVSVFLWFLHLVQIWIFALSLGAPVPLSANLALAPLAILAGLLPLTLGGIGTRDAALIYLFIGYMPPATGAALGILCTLRYLLPALGGLPFFVGFLNAARQMRDA